jgi:hypothetical protein
MNVIDHEFKNHQKQLKVQKEKLKLKNFKTN